MMRSTPDPSRVRFVGPLSLSASGLVEELLRLGYTPTTATVVMQLTAHLSRWLDAEGIELGEVSGGVVDDFLAVRRATYAQYYSLQALGPVLGFLRRGGLIPAELAPLPVSEVEVLLARYRHYLVAGRGLTGPVADAYSHWVTPFVREVLGAEPSAGIAGLTAVDVAGFLTRHLPPMTRKTA